MERTDDDKGYMWCGWPVTVLYDGEADTGWVMRKAEAGWGFEDVFLLGAAVVMLGCAAAAWVLRAHLHTANARVRYGMEHLPTAMAAAALFTVAIVAARFVVDRRSDVGRWPAWVFAAILAAVFCACWLPVVVAGGFVQDDWMLLAGASIRKVIYLHPGWSWYALDTVDGNFRPLGTVLYVGYLYRWFGLAPLPYLMGLFVVSLLGCAVSFLIVREMGYTKVAAAATALLYMTRGMIYTIVSWTCALGDGLAILLCGLMALLILKANKRQAAVAVALHAAAWACFFLATLAKQSAFAAPLIVALLLYLRPGEDRIPSHGRRLATAASGLAVYGATAAVTFFHAKGLLQITSPYPIGFSPLALLNTFIYPTYYLFPVDLPDKYGALTRLPAVLGIPLAAMVGVLVWKVRQLLGERPRDVVFALLATVASVSLFVVLSSRAAPYYGSMAAFWMSIALGIMLTRFAPGSRGARTCGFVFCLLLMVGFVDVRMKQTGLIPSGGYTWGTFGMDGQRAVYAGLDKVLAAHPAARVLVLDDTPGYASWYTAMALIADARLEKILVYDSAKQTYYSNDRGGARPLDDRGALRDPVAYNFALPLPVAEAEQTLAGPTVLRLGFHGGNIVVEDSHGGAAR